MTILYQSDFSTNYATDWGPDWSKLAGNAGLSVSGGVAQAVNGSTGNVMVAGTSSSDFDVTVTVVQGASGAILGPMARCSDGSNFYYLDLGAFNNTLTFGKRVGGTFTDVDLESFTNSVSTAYKLRLKVIGSHVQGKAWDASGSEPSSWLIDRTDTSLAGSGQAGIFVYAPNATPTTADDFLATDGSTTTTSTRTVPADAALLATSSRTISATAALLATETRIVPATGTLLATQQRNVPATGALLATETRTVGASAALLQTGARTIPASAALIETQARSVPTTAVLIATATRSIGATAALQMTATRAIPATAALLAQRIIPCSAALSGIAVAPPTNCTFYVRGGQGTFYVRSGNATFYVRK